MRILHLDPDDMDNPLSGGGPVRTFEICRRLARRHEITVLTPTFEGSTPTKEREGIRYVRLGRKIRNHGSSHHITFFFALPRAVRRYDYDLLVEDFMPPSSATLTPLFAKAPVVASVQWHFARVLSRQYKIPFWIWEKYGVRLYRDFVVLTRSMHDSIQARHPGARCRVIPNGVDDRLFTLPNRVGDYILYIGRVDFDQKGVDLLLDAYARVPNQRRCSLILAGHAFEYDTVRQRIAALGLDGQVEVIGRVDTDRRNALLAGCRFVCVPSREETFGMVIAEAAAAAKPAIVFDKPPMNEVVAPDAGIAVPAFDISAYAAALECLLAEPDDAVLNRGEACRTWARQFSWDAIADLQEAFYLESAERRAGP
jgi:glycosyltransferase involved in cell wall biosynthesis